MQALVHHLHAFAELVGKEGPIVIRAGLMTRTGADAEMTDEVEVGHPHAPVTLRQIADALAAIPPDCGSTPINSVADVRPVTDNVYELVWG